MPTESEKRPPIPQELIVLAEACSGHNRVSNRLWIYAATIALFAATGKISSDSIKFLGFEMDSGAFFPVSAFLLACVNIAYCSAFSQNHRISMIFQDYLVKIKADKTLISNRYYLDDVAYALPLPSFDRTFPLFHGFSEEKQDKAQTIFKPLVDIIFVIVPISGCLYALYESWFLSCALTTSLWALVPITLVCFVSLGATLLLYDLTIRRWRTINRGH